MQPTQAKRRYWRGRKRQKAKEREEREGNAHSGAERATLKSTKKRQQADTGTVRMKRTEAHEDEPVSGRGSEKSENGEKESTTDE